MNLRRRDTPDNSDFWDYIERAAREWNAQEPAWARRLRGVDLVRSENTSLTHRDERV